MSSACSYVGAHCLACSPCSCASYGIMCHTPPLPQQKCKWMETLPRPGIGGVTSFISFTPPLSALHRMHACAHFSFFFLFTGLRLPAVPTEHVCRPPVHVHHSSDKPFPLPQRVVLQAKRALSRSDDDGRYQQVGATCTLVFLSDFYSKSV